MSLTRSLRAKSATRRRYKDSSSIAIFFSFYSFFSIIIDSRFSILQKAFCQSLSQASLTRHFFIFVQFDFFALWSSLSCVDLRLHVFPAAELELRIHRETSWRSSCSRFCRSESLHLYLSWSMIVHHRLTEFRLKKSWTCDKNSERKILNYTTIAWQLMKKMSHEIAIVQTSRMSVLLR
jgi:hypothetical protein